MNYEKSILNQSMIYGSMFLFLNACGGGGNAPTPQNNSTPAGNNNAPPAIITPPPLACSAPDTNLSIQIAQVYANLTFNQPLAMLQAPGDSSRWFVLEKAGRVRAFSNTPDIAAFSPDFIDLRARANATGEGGLLGMAFHPNFANNGQVFISWTAFGAPMVSIISRFTTIAGGSVLDLSSELEILRLNQNVFTSHKGGHLAFGPDGYLYIGFGDGGGNGDPNGRAQDTTNLLGAFLRLDVSASRPGAPYTIPATNPFAGNSHCTADPDVSAGNCPEIYAWGMRNPWRWNFDTTTGILWAADVGQSAWEEINHIDRGGNYGWATREGAHCYQPSVNCSTAGLIDPIVEYGRTVGTSITGGYIYRGSVLPVLAGNYIFGDFGNGRIWRLQNGSFALDELIDTTLSISSFGQGNNGELYVIDIAGNKLYQITGATCPM